MGENVIHVVVAGVSHLALGWINFCFEKSNFDRQISMKRWQLVSEGSGALRKGYF